MLIWILKLNVFDSHAIFYKNELVIKEVTNGKEINPNDFKYNIYFT